MTRFCYDSTTTTDLPTTAKLVLRYVDGLYAQTHTAVKARCPKARQATVTVLGSLDADIADCEQGDLNPNSAAAWAHDKRAAGKGFPTIYCLDSQHAAVIVACHQRGLILHKHYNLWVANYDGNPAIPAYAVGKQYEDPTGTHHHYDLSAVRPYLRGIDPKRRRILQPVTPNTPQPIDAPKPQRIHRTFLGVPMHTIRTFLAGRWAWAKKHPRKAKAELAAFIGVLAASPTVHALIHHQPVTTTALIAAVTAAVVAAARKSA